MTNDFVLTMLFTFVYRKNENHWSLLICYSLPLASGNVGYGGDRNGNNRQKQCITLRDRGK